MNVIPQRPVVFLAPGSGLGHLVRTGALSLGLARLGVPSVILTTSPYAGGFSRITGIRVISVPFPSWADSCVRQVTALDPAVLVLDSFPMGLRGENLAPLIRTRPTLLLARRLRFNAYMDAVRSLNMDEPEGFSTLVIEPLSQGYLDWLAFRSGQTLTLENRIRFPWDIMDLPPVPEDLEKALNGGDLHLVVHGGPETEVRQLTGLVKGPMAVINPRMAAEGQPHCFDYFPASALYGKAHSIYTGAGYNAVAEITGPKHILVPFDRRYDDQAWRKNQPASRAEPGNTVAVGAIMATYPSPLKKQG